MDLLNIAFSLVALIILEIVLGIDNLVFLSILTEKLPVEQRRKARRWGLMFAWMTRLLLLASAVWLVKMTYPLFTIFDFAFSIRDLFLLFGGIFLIYKATQEIHYEVDEGYVPESTIKTYPKFNQVIIQVGLMDIIFSLDSVLTAIGLTDYFLVMTIAITCAIFVMIWLSEPIAAFIHKHPTIKMLALSFLILIGMVLIADGFDFHIPRGYIYVAMGFSMMVEGLNLLKRSRRKRRRNRKL